MFSRKLLQSLYFRCSLLIVLCAVAGLTALNKPPTELRLNEPSKSATYQIQEQPSYFEKILDPLSILTLSLVISTVFLWRSTDRLARLAEDQGRITNDLFLKDQRPWLKVEAHLVGSPVYDTKECSITLHLHISCENIGKGPAIEAADGISQGHIGYEGFQEDFDSISGFVAAQSATKGKTIFPSDEVDFNAEIILTRDDIEKSRSITEGLPMHFFTVGYAYRSNLSDALFETVRMYQFGIPIWQTPLPLPDDENWGKGIEFRLWKERVT